MSLESESRGEEPTDNGTAELHTRSRGETLPPDDDGSDAARTIWDGMIDRRPALVAQSTGTADVAAAVEFARENDVEVSIHGGGHSVAGKAVVADHILERLVWPTPST